MGAALCQSLYVVWDRESFTLDGSLVDDSCVKTSRRRDRKCRSLVVVVPDGIWLTNLINVTAAFTDGERIRQTIGARVLCLAWDDMPSVPTSCL